MYACAKQVANYILLSLVLKYVQYHVTATHFRGVHIWLDASDGAFEANIVYRVAWRRTYRGQSTYCDDVIIRAGTLIGPPGAGYIRCTEGCGQSETTIGNLEAQCTDYSVSEDWSVGIGNHTYAFPDGGPFVLRWQGSGWLAGVHFADDAPWSTRTVLDLTPRTDTGRVNSSPRSAVPPVMRLQHGCNHTITLPVTDPDGDVIQCRWAVATANECGGICGPFDGANLDPSCVFTYTADQQHGYFAVAIQIEDFMPEGIRTVNPLSSVPLQFLLSVYEPQSETACDARPEFVSPTPPADSCVYIKPDDRYTVQIVVRMKDEFVQLLELQTVSSIGMQKSEIYEYEPNPRDHAVNVTWVPTQAQDGVTIFCFTALSIGQISSEQRCLYLFIGEATAPTVALLQFNKASRRVSLTFNQPIKRPKLSKDIYVFSATTNQALLSYDASDANLVDVSDVTISFVLPEQYTQQNFSLYVRLQQGVVTSAISTQCGKDSQAVTDMSALRFNTFDDLVRPIGQEGTGKKDFTWLIVVIVCLILLFALITVIAVFVHRRRKAKAEYSREERQEEYARSVASKMATQNGAYTPDFNDIDVKFR